MYRNKKETSDETKEVTENGNQTLDKYYKKLNVNVTTDKKYTQEEYDAKTIATTKTLLWTNSTPSNNMGKITIDLNSSLANFSHILVEWKVKTNSSTIYRDLFEIQPTRMDATADSAIYGLVCFDNNTTILSRSIRYLNSQQLVIGNAFDQTYTFRTSYLIPTAIYGLNFSY